MGVRSDRDPPVNPLSGLFLPAAATITALAVLLALGFWQVQRLHWKNALIANVDERLEKDPVALDVVLAELEGGAAVEYRPVTLNGLFFHEGERHYYATHNGKVGWFIFTPLTRTDGSVVMVNRGFVPDALKEPAKRLEGQIRGAVTLEGLVRLPPAEKPNMFMPDNQPGTNHFYWRDLRQMIESSGLPDKNAVIPVFVDLRERDQAVPYPMAGTTRISFPNNHLQYAGTWFGLAFVLVCVFVVFARQRLRKNAGVKSEDN